MYSPGMSKRIPTTLSMTAERAAFASAEVAMGCYGSAGEVVRAGLHPLIEHGPGRVRPNARETAAVGTHGC